MLGLLLTPNPFDPYICRAISQLLPGMVWSSERVWGSWMVTAQKSLTAAETIGWAVYRGGSVDTSGRYRRRNRDVRQVG